MVFIYVITYCEFLEEYPCIAFNDEIDADNFIEANKNNEKYSYYKHKIELK